MKANDYWQIIDSSNQETAEKNQSAFLAAVDSKLYQLPSTEIVDWFNIHQNYMKLADNKAVEKAARDCSIYLSDDSFLYFRGWLVSLGKDAFYSILNNPDTLSNYVNDPSDTRFESFVYAGHDVYTKKTFLEEYGPDGTEQWKKNWLAENPDKGEYGLEWALGTKYDLWSASNQRPLSNDEKDAIKNDLFFQSKDNKIEILRSNTELKPVETVFADMFPDKNEDYRSFAISLYSGYEPGFGMLPAASDAFHKEMQALFSSAGWEYHAPLYMNASPEYSKGKSRLYCHPLKISGPCEANLVDEVISLVSKATECCILRVEDKGRIYDLSDDQYLAALEPLRSSIEKDLLIAFSNPNIGADSTCFENVVSKYCIPTLNNRTGMMSSTKPYWKYINDVYNDLIAQKKIVEKPKANSFSSRTYITATEFQVDCKSPSLDEQIQKANVESAKRTTTLHSTDRKQDFERDF